MALVCLAVSNMYLFHFIVALNPGINSSKRLLSSPFDKATIEDFHQYRYQKFSLYVLVLITQFSNQVKVKDS